MATIGSLAVNVVARTEALQKGLMKSQSLIKGFAFAAGAGMAGITAGVFAATKAFQDLSPRIDEIAKASDRLNISTQALTALGHAADLSGVSLANLTKSLTFMERNLGDSVIGTTTATRWFDQMGLSVQRLMGLSADDAFLEIAAAIDALPTAAEKSAAAMAVFGRSGAALLPLMAEGSEGIRAMMEDAERLGITFDRQQAAMVEQANDAMTRVGAAFDGLKTRLVIGLSPALEMVANDFANYVADTNAATKQTDMLGNSVVRTSAFLLDMAHSLRIMVKGVHFTIVQSLSASLGTVENLGKGVIGTVNSIIQAINDLTGSEMGMINNEGLNFIQQMRDDAERLRGEIEEMWNSPPSQRLYEMLQQMNGAASGGAGGGMPSRARAIMEAAGHLQEAAAAVQAADIVGSGTLTNVRKLGAMVQQMTGGGMPDFTPSGDKMLGMVSRDSKAGAMAAARVGPYRPGSSQDPMTRSARSLEKIETIMQRIDKAVERAARQQPIGDFRVEEVNLV